MTISLVAGIKLPQIPQLDIPWTLYGGRVRAWVDASELNVWTYLNVHKKRPYFGKSFFPYTFLEHGFGNLGFRKNHCRPWYILHNCKSTDLKTNLKHLDKVLHNHKHMLNNKMCFVREIESSFFWSERECKFRNSTRPEIEMGESSEEISETVSPDLTHILLAAPYIAVFVHCLCICICLF